MGDVISSLFSLGGIHLLEHLRGFVAGFSGPGKKEACGPYFVTGASFHC